MLQMARRISPLGRNLVQVSAGGGAPTDPAAGYNIWLKADSLALSDGDPVSAWADETGDHSGSQSGSARPTFRVNVQNGKPGVEFDGVDDGMTLALPASYFIKQHYMVLKSPTSTFGNYGNVIGTNSASARGYLFANGTTHLFSDQYPLAVRRNTVDVSSPFDLAPITNCMLVVVNSSILTVAGYSRLGDSEGFRPGFTLLEVIGYPTVLSSTERDTTEAYLNGKYAIY